MIIDKDNMINLKIKLKEIVQNLINNGQLDDAEEQIRNYEEIIKDDIDILCMKVVISVYRNNLENALKIIDTGLKIDSLNIDLLYNKAYIYNLQNDKEKAITYYKKVMKYTDDILLRNEVIELLSENYNQNISKNDLEKVTFVVLCPGWGKILKRSHHIATTLSELGYDVYSVSTVPVINNNIKTSLEYKELYKGVNIHTLIKNEDYKEISSDFINIAQDIVDKSINKVLFITQNPNDYFILGSIKGDFEIIYECVDDNTDLENAFWSSTKTIDYEQEIMNKASIITTVSTSLYMNKRFIENRSNVYLLKNAVNISDFEDKGIYPDEFKNIPKPIVLHVGVIYDRFDEELLYKLVRKNRDKSFVMVGTISGKMLQEKEDNLYILGPKNHNELKYYMRNSDIGIVPLKDNTDMAINCDSIKIYEYLASGLPVITTKLPDVCLFDKAYIKAASKFDQFNKYINDILLSKENYKNDMKQLIESHTWNNRVISILDALRGNINEKEQDDEIIVTIRKSFKRSLEQEYDPSIESSYAMTYFEDDIETCLKHAENAYRNRNINHTFRNYIQALLKLGKIDYAVNEILKNNNIPEEYRAELISLANNKKHKEFIIKLIMKDYNYLRKNLDSLYTKSIYSFEIEDYVKSNELYSDLCESKKEIHNTPIVNRDVSKLLAMAGKWKSSENVYFNSLELIDKYLNRKSRLKKHQSLFDVNVKTCHLCSSKKYKLIAKRPDGIDIVKCEECGLVFTSKKPSDANLGEIYKYENYYNGGICGYRFGYENLNKKLMFSNRCNWINKNSLAKNSILDIGCSTGDFLEVMKNNGWNTYGIEISDYAYNICLNKGINMYNKSLIDCKLESNNFDCITMWSVLEHYTNPMRELEEVYRILKEDGKIYIAVPNNTRATLSGENCYEYNLSYEHLIYFDTDPLIQMVKKAGFKIEQCFYGNLVHLYDMTPIGTHIYLSATK